MIATVYICTFIITVCLAVVSTIIAFHLDTKKEYKSKSKLDVNFDFDDESRISESKQEYSVLDLAVQEILEHGYTSQRCPRCGKELVYTLQGSREIIGCSEPTCIKSIRRGI